MNIFKKLFQDRKINKRIRQNLVISIDDPRTGDHEVLSIMTGPTENVVVKFNVPTDKMSVNPQDLQDALNLVNDFNAARGEQPNAQQPLGIKHLEATAALEQKAVQEVKQEQEKIKPVLDLSN